MIGFIFLLHKVVPGVTTGGPYAPTPSFSATVNVVWLPEPSGFWPGFCGLPTLTALQDAYAQCPQACRRRSTWWRASSWTRCSLTTACRTFSPAGTHLTAVLPVCSVACLCALPLVRPVVTVQLCNSHDCGCSWVHSMFSLQELFLCVYGSKRCWVGNGLSAYVPLHRRHLPYPAHDRGSK